MLPKSQWSRVFKALFQPSVRPVETKKTPGDRDILDIAVHDGLGVPLHRSTDTDDFTAHLGVRPKLNIAQHRHDFPTDMPVNISVAQHRHGHISHCPTGDASVAENRHHRIAHIARRG